MTPSSLESLFVANLPAIERILATIARRHALSYDTAQDFGGWVRLKFLENDYALLAKFRGESSLATYLTVVVALQYREFRVEQWGRWRPSAAARRAGELGIRLETLLHRDHVSLVEAAQSLRTAGLTTLSDRRLARLAASFPKRRPLRPVSGALPTEEPIAADRADALVEEQELSLVARALHSALKWALDNLSAEDRLLVRMHYLDGLSVADIARGLGLPQKPLYRRLQRALTTLRNRLEQAGVSRTDVRRIVGGNG
jgi:RNA polymerase sigma factor (sigma-70 family)